MAKPPLPPTHPPHYDDAPEEDTPNERLEPTLPEHRPYVRALAAVIAPLHSTVLMLSDVLHEFRVAREPASRALLDQLAAAGKTIKGVGGSLEDGFTVK